MRRRLTPEERRLWALVARTVEARPGRAGPEPSAPPVVAAPVPRKPPRETDAAEAQRMRDQLAALVAGVRLPPPPRPAVRAQRHEPDPLEPRRLRRLARERDPIEARIDLHGMGAWEAEDRLKAFLRSAWAQGLRAVLVVTGKGSTGDGVIRRYAPEWLASRDLRDIVAGVSAAHRRHGGEGALYVALKRRRS